MFTKDFLWVQSRTRTLSNEVLEKIRQKIAEALPDYNFDNLVHYTYQGKDCKYDQRLELSTN